VRQTHCNIKVAAAIHWGNYRVTAATAADLLSDCEAIPWLLDKGFKGKGAVNAQSRRNIE